MKLGATTWGGMWAATQKLEDELIKRRGWLRKEDLPFLLMAATLIPAPKFMALGGLVGYRLRGWWGSAVAALALLAPGALLVLLAVILVPPAVLAGPLAPVQRAVAVTVVGLFLGTARRQMKEIELTGRGRLMGNALGLAVAVAAAAGVPVLLAVVAGMAVGAALFRGERTP